MSENPKVRGSYRLNLIRGGRRRECVAYFNPPTSHWLDLESMHTGNIGWADRITPPDGEDEWVVESYELLQSD